MDLRCQPQASYIADHHVLLQLQLVLTIYVVRNVLAVHDLRDDVALPLWRCRHDVDGGDGGGEDRQGSKNVYNRSDSEHNQTTECTSRVNK